MPLNNFLVSPFADNCLYYGIRTEARKLKKKVMYFSSKMLKRLSKKKKVSER